MDRGRVSYMRIMIGNDLNSDSFESLFKSHFGDLVGFVCSYVNDEEVAKDIVHDVFLVVLKNQKKLDTSYSLKSYCKILSIYVGTELCFELLETFACCGYERAGSCRGVAEC